LPPGCVSFFDHPTSSFAGRLIGLNELHPTMDDIEVTMSQKARKLPRVAYDTVRNAARQFKAGRLNTVVRNKMGDGSLGVGDDIWEVEGHKKKTLDVLMHGNSLEDPR
jgi:hypothetical protein